MNRTHFKSLQNWIEGKIASSLKLYDLKTPNDKTTKELKESIIKLVKSYGIDINDDNIQIEYGEEYLITISFPGSDNIVIANWVENTTVRDDWE